VKLIREMQSLIIDGSVRDSNTFIVATSEQARLPAKFKHINKRRKETNKDSLSNGERKGKSPALNLVPPGCYDMWRLGRGIART